MKKVLFVTFAVCLFAMAAMAQKTSFAGTWTLDASRSKLDERMRIDSITLTVVQTAKDITITTATKRLPPNDAPPAGGGRGMGRGGDGTNTYSLDGKEIKAEVDGPMGKVPVIYKGNLEADGTLKISSNQSFNGPNGEITITRKEAWKLSADGKSLTIEREQSSPRGSNTSTLVFTKS